MRAAIDAVAVVLDSACVVDQVVQMRNCIRLRGMPYSASLDMIMAFLGECSQYILPSGVNMVLNQQVWDLISEHSLQMATRSRDVDNNGVVSTLYININRFLILYIKINNIKQLNKTKMLWKNAAEMSIAMALFLPSLFI